MEMNDIRAKVNYYSALERERELTPEEQEERQKYRKLYLENIRAQVRGQLDSVKVVYVDEDNNPIEPN